MDFRPYPKIASSRQPASRVAPGGVWVATEKIHGAQLVVASNGREEAVGKRKAWLARDDAFFGWQLLKADLVAAVRAMHRGLGLSHDEVRVYGELFGGAYPHEAVKPVTGLSAVQTGIWYAPDVRFAVFDIVVGDACLAHAEVEAASKAAGLAVVPLLGRGPRAELERLPVRFPTRVPAMFGLPAIAGNVAEGFVLKPDVRSPTASRVVTKWKIPDFDDAQFDESMPFDSGAVLPFDALALHASRMVNRARIASARSKVGEDEALVLDEVVLDVLVDLEAAFPAALRALDAAEEDALRRAILGLARAAW